MVGVPEIVRASALKPSPAGKAGVKVAAHHCHHWLLAGCVVIVVLTVWGLVGNVCALREAWGSVSHCRRINGDGERQTVGIAACHVGIAIHDCVGVGLHTSGHGWRARDSTGIGIKAESSRQGWGQGVSQRTIATTGFWQGERGNRGVNGVGLVGNVLRPARSLGQCQPLPPH